MKTDFDEMQYIVEYFIVNISLPSYVLLRKLQDENSIYIMPEQYRTIGRYYFSLTTEHAHQHCNMHNNKSDVPEFPK